VCSLLLLLILLALLVTVRLRGLHLGLLLLERLERAFGLGLAIGLFVGHATLFHLLLRHPGGALGLCHFRAGAVVGLVQSAIGRQLLEVGRRAGRDPCALVHLGAQEERDFDFTTSVDVVPVVVVADLGEAIAPEGTELVGHVRAFELAQDLDLGDEVALVVLDQDALTAEFALLFGRQEAGGHEFAVDDFERRLVVGHPVDQSTASGESLTTGVLSLFLLGTRFEPRLFLGGEGRQCEVALLPHRAGFRRLGGCELGLCQLASARFIGALLVGDALRFLGGPGARLAGDGGLLVLVGGLFGDGTDGRLHGSLQCGVGSTLP
jgi:hypothetical protein